MAAKDPLDDGSDLPVLQHAINTALPLRLIAEWHDTFLLPVKGESPGLNENTGLMPVFNIQAAFDYYANHIHRQERFDLLEGHNFEVAGSIPPIDWELFGAILTGDDRKTGYGSDLKDHEVKSAVEGNSFEYQYHKHGGVAKLDEDKNVDHIFASYSPDYKRVTVRLVDRTKLSSTFESWRAGLIQNYQGTAPRQRYRKSISYGTVTRDGEIILRIEGGQLAQSTGGMPPIPEPPH